MSDAELTGLEDWAAREALRDHRPLIEGDFDEEGGEVEWCPVCDEEWPCDHALSAVRGYHVAKERIHRLEVLNLELISELMKSHPDGTAGLNRAAKKAMSVQSSAKFLRSTHPEGFDGFGIEGMRGWRWDDCWACTSMLEAVARERVGG